VSTKVRTRKGRNPYTGKTVRVPVKAKRAKRAKLAKKAVKAIKPKRRAKEPRDLIALRIARVEREVLELRASELNLSFSEVIRQGLREHYQLPEVPMERKEKVLS
jgi:hypothetical protein